MSDQHNKRLKRPFSLQDLSVDDDALDNHKRIGLCDANPRIQSCREVPLSRQSPTVDLQNALNNVHLQSPRSAPAPSGFQRSARRSPAVSRRTIGDAITNNNNNNNNNDNNNNTDVGGGASFPFVPIDERTAMSSASMAAAEAAAAAAAAGGASSTPAMVTAGSGTSTSRFLSVGNRYANITSSQTSSASSSASSESSASTVVAMTARGIKDDAQTPPIRGHSSSYFERTANGPTMLQLNGDLDEEMSEEPYTADSIAAERHVQITGNNNAPLTTSQSHPSFMSGTTTTTTTGGGGGSGRGSGSGGSNLEHGAFIMRESAPSTDWDWSSSVGGDDDRSTTQQLPPRSRSVSMALISERDFSHTPSSGHLRPGTSHTGDLSDLSPISSSDGDDDADTSNTSLGAGVYGGAAGGGGGKVVFGKSNNHHRARRHRHRHRHGAHGGSGGGGDAHVGNGAPSQIRRSATAMDFIAPAAPPVPTFTQTLSGTLPMPPPRRLPVRTQSAVSNLGPRPPPPAVPLMYKPKPLDTSASSSQPFRSRSVAASADDPGNDDDDDDDDGGYGGNSNNNNNNNHHHHHHNNDRNAPMSRLPLAVWTKSEIPCLRAISADTLASVLRHTYEKEYDRVYILDSRYDFEFDGGHINGAVNISTKQQLESMFFNDRQHLSTLDRVLIVFHCEYSQRRGPTMCHYLRRRDRFLKGIEHFPLLSYPELYVLAGGYAEFSARCPDLCTPHGAYRRMDDPAFDSELNASSRLWKQQSWKKKADDANLAASILTFPSGNSGGGGGGNDNNLLSVSRSFSNISSYSSRGGYSNHDRRNSN